MDTGSALESMGFARMAPDELIREDELEVVPLLRAGFSRGLFDLAWATRLGRAHAEGLRLVAAAWAELYHARFEGRCWHPAATSAPPWSRPPSWPWTSCRWWTPRCWPSTAGGRSWYGPRIWSKASSASWRRPGELGRPQRVPAMSFVDLVGYTRLTEERGDQAAAALAESLAIMLAGSIAASSAEVRV